jgi:hypothetical protein
MRYFKRIRYKLEPLLIELSLLLNWPWLTAQVIIVNSQVLNPGGKYTVLVLRRSIFMQDIKAMSEFSGKIKYVAVERVYLRQILNHFLKPEEIAMMTESNYHVSEIGKEGKGKYYHYLRRILPILKRKIGFQAAMGSTIGYREQQEFVRVCEENGTPFVILHKEGLAILDSFTKRAEQFKGLRFLGTKILFYNEKVKNAFLGAGVAGLTQEKTGVVGIPRLDFYFQRPKNHKAVFRQVTLFSFLPKEKFRFLAGNSRVLAELERRTSDFHKWLIKFAAKNPDVEVVIKTKNFRYYVEYVQEIYQSCSPKKLSNLIITNSADPKVLIRDSIAVLSFYSTTLIEAVLADKLVITPDYAGLLPENEYSADFFRDYPEFVNCARSESDLEKLILDSEEPRKFSVERRNQFLEGFIFTPDGQASKRAENEVIQTINL